MKPHQEMPRKKHKPISCESDWANSTWNKKTKSIFLVPGPPLVPPWYSNRPCLTWPLQSFSSQKKCNSYDSYACDACHRNACPYLIALSRKSNKNLSSQTRAELESKLPWLMYLSVESDVDQLNSRLWSNKLREDLYSGTLPLCTAEQE